MRCGRVKLLLKVYFKVINATHYNPPLVLNGSQLTAYKMFSLYFRVCCRITNSIMSHPATRKMNQHKGLQLKALRGNNKIDKIKERC